MGGLKKTCYYAYIFLISLETACNKDHIMDIEDEILKESQEEIIEEEIIEEKIGIPSPYPAICLGREDK